MDRNQSKQRESEVTIPKASQLMQQWHPDLFPDSSNTLTESLPRDFLEYHLETLTNRGQEQLFEDFCRRLIELEVCPNIKPQTGPTGGGDSKVDASNYPVSPVLADRYYWGNPSPPTVEAWGFAFSCKKAWKGKIKEDAEKISKLERKFTTVFFITSQFVRDRDRAELEDEMKRLYGFNSHIFDRTWIVECVINRNHQRIAIAALGISYQQAEETKLGPRDLKRSQELETILDRIKNLPDYAANDFTLAQDYLQAALLKRGLGRPRHEVDGLFIQARRLANKTGDRSLKIRCTYNQAWTAFWWFEDTRTFAELFHEVELLANGSFDVEDLELAVNLWFLTAGKLGQGSPESNIKVVLARSSHLKAELQRLVDQTHRPNSSLQAQSLILMIRIFEEKDNEDALRSILLEMREILNHSVGLATFPALQFIERFKILDNVLGDFSEYELLFEKMCEIIRVRSGDAAEGELLYERGMRHLRADNAPDALRTLGQARACYELQ